MRLKSLEIKGFKSFANQTVINFQEDVIGIVGPNGSGKSNIVDAIRWVLGEQKSRELRLDQMSSVLFNGTKKRKASGVASVSLTFENTKNILPTEYQDVTITRMLYRTGESEYRLNGVTCRLKDITSLFLDTGIGSNSYAIIALGMVDDILADKDNSRRKMFEQAAGISKYKVRKRQALNKLKNTTADLDRVEDLLHEIAGNLKSLERQAKRTKRYFELKEKYKELSVELALLQMESHKQDQKQLQRQIDEEQQKYRKLDGEIKTIEAQLEKNKKGNLDKEKALSDRQRELNTLVGRIRGMENDRRMVEQKQQFILNNKETLGKEIQEASQKVQQLRDDIEHYREELNLEKRVEARLEQELEAAEEELQKVRASHGSVKEDLDQVMQVQQAKERELYELEKQKAINFNEIENNRQERQRTENDRQKREGEVKDLHAKMEELQSRENIEKATLAELEQKEEKRLAELESTEAEAEKVNRRITKVRRELDAKRNEFKLTKSMVENLEGFPESIKFLKSSKEWKEEAPLLSDIMYVSDTYRVAIENYLDPYLNYYVVDTLKDAYEAIQLLGRSQKGKANFFVLEAFQDYTAPMTLVPDMHRAIDLVQTDPKYFNLVSYLLENVLLTEKEHFNGALPEQDVVVLSISGRLIQKRFSVSGGSIGLFEGKRIGRQKNLELLDESIKQSEVEEDQYATTFYNLKKKIEALKAERLDQQIQAQQNRLNQLVQERVSFSTRLENFESFIQEVIDKEAKINERITALQKANAEIEKAIETKQQEVNQAKESIANTDGSYRKLADQLSEISTAYNEKNIQFIRQQNKVSTFQKELSFREKELENTQSKLQRDQKQLGSADQEIDQLGSESLQMQEKLEVLYKQRKEKESLLTEAEQTYFKARGTITELEDQLRKQNRQLQDLQILINKLKEKFNDVKYQISTIAQRFKIEFDVSINEIINQEPKRDQPQEVLEDKVEKLRSRLQNYGEINPMAVEAFDEMKDRHDNITQQRDDIVEAKASLEETIKEIEETATQQFLDAFEKARNYFIEVFRSLFTEDDTCDLMLLDPDDPLESKIEIIAKPKGKRPQSISQLSGGEKTLTATALLFALYLLKPAPFCIFDEVDAPLDDANILKFNKIIKQFSKESQFIIVTHNKLTMAAVDTIYGVYMGEQGVSGVMPVDFRDYDHKISFEAAGG
ncbi:MAG TPA: chromosome segregation protein SMC [Saprospiraceae bacterium]|nr:chromosome segregation protein SMC [Saprospiraceae bacterium]